MPNTPDGVSFQKCQISHNKILRKMPYLADKMFFQIQSGYMVNNSYLVLHITKTRQMAMYEKKWINTLEVVANVKKKNL